MIKIYDSDGKIILEVEVDDTSYRYRAIMGDDSLTLKFALAEHMEIPVGAYVEWQGDIYTLERPEALTMKHSRYFEYTVTFDSPQAKAKIWKFRNTVDGRLKFSLTAKPSEHLQMFVDNMNAREDGWEVGECVDGDETLISYDHAYCYDALGQMADTFETEFEIKGRVVSLHKVEYFKSDPLALSYGRGNGFQPSVGRANYGDLPPIETLYTQGGSDNIDTSKYGNSELLLPKGQEIAYDGEHFEDEDGYEADNARTYVTDEQGYSISRKDKEPSSKAEDSLDCSEIYPKRVGVVSAVDVIVSGENTYYDIIDEDIPSTLDYTECQIAGETMTVIFQSGMLAGKEFEVDAYVHGERRFELVPQEIDGQTMPNETFSPAVGDKYAVFGCMLPDSYVCDNATKSGAEWDMFRKAVKYLYDNEEQKYTISGKLDGIWSRKDWENIGGHIVLGGYIRFTDARWQEDPVDLRIIGVKDYVNKPHSPDLELSNATVTAGFASTLNQMASKEVLIEDNYKKSVSYTKRRFRDAQETITLLQEVVDYLSANFTESISPITIQTMMMLVGDESLQFRFVTALSSDTAADLYVTYDSEKKQLSVSGPGSDGISYLQHLTLGIDTITTDHTYLEYLCWAIPAFVSGSLDDGDQTYYLYAKVADYAQTGEAYQTGEFRLEKEAHAMESEDGYYWLLVGILNSEYDGTRSFITLYGFTEILPGRITTDKIVSADGRTYFDLVNGIISGRITFLSSDGTYKDLSDTDDQLQEQQEFIDKTLNKIIYDLSDDIDGEIDTWFTSDDPGSGWTDDETKKSHVGDIWYNPAEDKLYYYSAELKWVEVDDEEALASYRAAYKAQDTADGKRRIFIDTPTPPYDVGDLWYGAPVTSATADDGNVAIPLSAGDGDDGTDSWDTVSGGDTAGSITTSGQRKLLVCVNAKAEGEDYESSDWSENLSYDNTQTVIDGGIVTSGTIQVAGDENAVLAGMTGKGTTDDSVRFWAGDTFDNRAAAVFRVLQDGSFIASKATIEGKITATSGAIGGLTISGDQLASTSGTYQMTMTPGLIAFRKTDDSGKEISVLLLGNITDSYTSGDVTVKPVDITVSRTEPTSSIGPYANVGIRLEVSGIKDSSGYRDFTSESYSQAGNHALYIAKGDIYGFRLKTRRVSASQTLSTMDSIIIASTNSNSSYTLTLPSDAEDGQIYFIRNVGLGNVYVNSETIASGKMAIVIYDAVNDTWYVNLTS